VSGDGLAVADVELVDSICRPCSMCCLAVETHCWCWRVFEDR